MTIRLYTPEAFSTRRVRVLLIGVGGTGSEVFDGLVRLHLALERCRHEEGHEAGLEVTVMDGDVVSESNIGRQRFGHTDIDYNKAIVLVNRYGLFYGLDWKAIPEYVGLRPDGAAEIDLTEVDLLVSCVDRASVRVGLALAGSEQRCKGLWADFGNSARTGQFVLGHLGPAPPGSQRVPHVLDLYPELREVNDDAEPSCSFEEAIRHQDLFVNPMIAHAGMCILWNLFRHGSIDTHGAFIDVARPCMQPLQIDPATWSFFGYRAQTHRAAQRSSKVRELGFG